MLYPAKTAKKKKTPFAQNNIVRTPFSPQNNTKPRKIKPKQQILK